MKNNAQPSIVVVAWLSIFWGSLWTCVSATNAPIIALFAIPHNSETNYIPASYLKWIEAGGGRPLVVQYDTDKSELDHLFKSVNGLLFIGGGGDPSGSARYFFNLALEANKVGDYFPVWGTCLGFEWIMEMVSGNDEVLYSDFLSDNLTLPLDFTSETETSRMGSALGSDILRMLNSEPLTFNYHTSGVTVSDFYETPALSNFFNLLSTNFDRNEREFVSWVEGKDYPIYAVQFHPEKNMFEWGRSPTNGRFYESIPHGSHAIKTAASMAQFFIDEARRSDHAFSNAEEELMRLAYNDIPTYTGAPSHPGSVVMFMQTYYFDAAAATSPLVRMVSSPIAGMMSHVVDDNMEGEEEEHHQRRRAEEESTTTSVLFTLSLLGVMAVCVGAVSSVLYVSLTKRRNIEEGLSSSSEEEDYNNNHHHHHHHTTTRSSGGGHQHHQQYYGSLENLS